MNLKLKIKSTKFIILSAILICLFFIYTQKNSPQKFHSLKGLSWNEISKNNPNLPNSNDLESLFDLVGESRLNNDNNNDNDNDNDNQNKNSIFNSDSSNNDIIKYPVKNLIKLPKKSLRKKLPKIQSSTFNNIKSYKQSEIDKKEELTLQKERLESIKNAFMHSWNAYKKYAWLHDELKPISLDYHDPFTGWAATLVDSLDTLQIMKLDDEFNLALDALNQIDFSVSTRHDIPVFETVIRYLGGLISSYDLSDSLHSSNTLSFDTIENNKKILLSKAVQLADNLMGAFDTPNHMPILFYRWSTNDKLRKLRPDINAVLAEAGSLTLEFTRLAQITGNNTYFDAVQRITNEFESSAQSMDIPWLFPQRIDISGCRALSFHQLDSNIASAGYLPSSHTYNIDSDSPLDKKALNSFLTNNKNNKPPYKTYYNPDGTFFAKLKNFIVHCAPQGIKPSPKSHIRRYTIGGLADSLYEYFPKAYQLLGGSLKQYKIFYEKSISAVTNFLIYRPLLPGDPDILFAGAVDFTKGSTTPQFDFEMSHLSCFAGGMYALGSKLFDRPQDLEIAAKLTDGCFWAYSSTVTGLMPEWFRVKGACRWDGSNCNYTKIIEKEYDNEDDAYDSNENNRKSYKKNYDNDKINANSIPQEIILDSFTDLNPKYILRPEAIESIFYMYRITGDKQWQEKGWKMFEAIEKYTRTADAHAPMGDVTNDLPNSPKLDSMESFFLAETLKYFYLLFSSPDLISLDDYVFNTEAHPFKVEK